MRQSHVTCQVTLNHRCIVRMLDCFVYRNHQCIGDPATASRPHPQLCFSPYSPCFSRLHQNNSPLPLLSVTELLNLSLYPPPPPPPPPHHHPHPPCSYDLLKRTKLTGVSLNLVKKFAFQMLLTLEFLLQPDVNVVHCDMKPENVRCMMSKASAVVACVSLRCRRVRVSPPASRCVFFSRAGSAAQRKQLCHQSHRLRQQLQG
jgi:hypothetical protein